MKSTTLLSIVSVALAIEAPVANKDVAENDSQEKFFWFSNDDDSEDGDEDCGCEEPEEPETTTEVPSSSFSSSSSVPTTELPIPVTTPKSEEPVPASTSQQSSEKPSEKPEPTSTTQVIVPETFTVSSTTLKTVTSCPGTNGTCHEPTSAEEPVPVAPSSTSEYTGVLSANGAASFGAALGGVVAAMLI